MLFINPISVPVAAVGPVVEPILSIIDRVEPPAKYARTVAVSLFQALTRTQARRRYRIALAGLLAVIALSFRVIANLSLLLGTLAVRASEAVEPTESVVAALSEPEPAPVAPVAVIQVPTKPKAPIAQNDRERRILERPNVNKAAVASALDRDPKRYAVAVSAPLQPSDRPSSHWNRKELLEYANTTLGLKLPKRTVKAALLAAIEDALAPF